MQKDKLEGQPKRKYEPPRIVTEKIHEARGDHCAACPDWDNIDATDFCMVNGVMTPSQ
jgi:hypothetical protein